MFYSPTPLQSPQDHVLHQATSFTPGGRLLGTAFDSRVGNGQWYETVLRWDAQGAVEALAGRMRNVMGRVVGTNDGLVVFSAAYDHEGDSKPLAIIGGQVIDLGAAYTGPTTVARMNASGAFVGVTGPATQRSAYVATVQGMRLVVTPRPAAESSAAGITDDGTIVGSWRETPGAPWRGYVERGGVAEDLRELQPAAINQSQIAVGRISGGAEFSFGLFDLRQRPPVWQALALPRGAEYMLAHDIDDVGEVAGYSWQGSPASTPYLGFVSAEGAATGLDILMGMPGQVPRITAMSRAGSIAGPLGAGFFIAHPGAAPVVATSPKTAVRAPIKRR